MRLQAYLWFAAALAFLSAGIVRVMIRVGTIDHPGARSSHTQPTPRGGGVGIVAAFVFGMAVLFTATGRTRVPDAAFLGLVGASVGIAAVSYIDDVADLPFTIKLAAQLAAALVAITCGIRLRLLHLPWVGVWDTGLLGVILTAAWIVFVTNAVNFIDGLNGLASGSVAIACLVLAAIGWSQGNWLVYTASLVLAAGIAGFLPFNFPYAHIFMGDVGSQFCGFVLAVIGVQAANFGPQTLSVLLVPMLLMGVLFDVSFTLLRRLIAAEPLTQAHRGHLYQVAQRSGIPAWAVAQVHWGMVAWGWLCCVGFIAIPAPWKPAIAIAVLAPQFAWLAIVANLAQRAGITRW